MLLTTEDIIAIPTTVTVTTTAIDATAAAIDDAAADIDATTAAIHDTAADINFTADLIRTTTRILIILRPTNKIISNTSCPAAAAATVQCAA